MYWTLKIRNGPPGILSSAICVGNKIYCFGDRFGIPINIIPMIEIDFLDVHVLNMETLRWARVPAERGANVLPLRYPDVPPRHSGETAFAYLDKIYILGGYTRESELYCFNPETSGWSRPTVTGSVPNSYAGDAACVVGHFMYLFRMQLDEAGGIIPFLDLSNFQWHTLRAVNRSPGFHCSLPTVSINECIYMIGGTSTTYGKIFYFDIKTRKWHRTWTSGDRPFGRSHYSMFVHNAHIYTVTTQGLHSFDPRTNCWELIRPPGVAPSLHFGYFCIMKDTKMYFLGEHSYDGRNYYNPSCILDFAPTLKTLAISAVVENNLNTSCLPATLQEEVRSQSDDVPAQQNSILQLIQELHDIGLILH